MAFVNVNYLLGNVPVVIRGSTVELVEETSREIAYRCSSFVPFAVSGGHPPASLVLLGSFSGASLVRLAQFLDALWSPKKAPPLSLLTSNGRLWLHWLGEGRHEVAMLLGGWRGLDVPPVYLSSTCLRILLEAARCIAVDRVFVFSTVDPDILSFRLDGNGGDVMVIVPCYTGPSGAGIPEEVQGQLDGNSWQGTVHIPTAMRALRIIRRVLQDSCTMVDLESAKRYLLLRARDRHTHGADLEATVGALLYDFAGLYAAVSSEWLYRFLAALSRIGESDLRVSAEGRLGLVLAAERQPIVAW